MCTDVPMPELPYDHLPGCAFAAATNSAMVLMPSWLGTVSMVGPMVSRDSGVKASMLKGRLRISRPMMA